MSVQYVYKMKILHSVVTSILLTSCFVLLYSTVNFELAEKYFEGVRNGTICNNPGSNCPYPSFDTSVSYGIIGLGIFSVGVGISIRKKRLKVTRIFLGIISITTGILPFTYGLLAYVDDYNHWVQIMKNCPNTSCMYPDIFPNILFIQFFITYGIALIGVGVFVLAYFRGKSKT